MMTDKEIITMAGEYGAWIGGHEITFTDAGLLELVRSIEKAEREACATAIEELITLLDPERETTLNLAAYTCRHKHMPQEKNHAP
jgi:2',3'-cyclic-nucleotide 2'-phosphodiesterase (5'-nucleotidase family)